MSGMVLCCPYLVVAVAAGMPVLLENKRTRAVAAWAVCGIAVSAAVYVTFFLRQITMEELTVNLPYILNDPQHTMTLSNQWDRLREMAEPFFTKRMLQIIAVFSGVVLVCRLVKGSMPGWLWLGYFLFTAAIVYRSILGAQDNICFVFNFPFSHCMIPVVLHSMMTKGCRKLHLVFFLGLAMSGAFFFASNTMLCAMTTGYAIASAAAVMLIPSVIRRVAPAEKKSAIRIMIRVAALCIFVMLLGTAGAHRFLGFYRDAPIEQLTVRLEEGPAAGLLTSEENARQYKEIYADIRSLCQEMPDAYVFHTAKTPWAYLCADWRYGAHTAWTTQLDSAHLADYYLLNEEKVPDLVFVYPPHVGAYQSVPFNNHKEDLAPNWNNLYGSFFDDVVSCGEILFEKEFVTVYRIGE